MDSNEEEEPKLLSDEENDEPMFLTDGEKLAEAERLVYEKDFVNAQKLLDEVQGSAEKFFVQGELFRQKAWLNEARKCFKKAIKMDEGNEKYLAALDELESFKKSDEFKEVKKKQMGGSDEACCECCCECTGAGICQAICDGCS